MPIKPIPYKLPSLYNVTPQHDEAEFMGIKKNMWLTNENVLRRRPGRNSMTHYSGSSVAHNSGFIRVGLQSTTSNNTDYLAIQKDNSGNIRVVKLELSSTSLTATVSTGTALSGLPTSSRIGHYFHSYNADEFVVMVPRAQELIVYDYNANTTTTINPAAPIIQIRGMTYVDGYFILTAYSVLGNTFYWCNVEDLSTWDTSDDFAQSSYKGDHVLNLFASEGEFYIVNSHSLEMWQNDGQSPFSRIAGGAIDFESIHEVMPVPNIQNTYLLMGAYGELYAFRNRQIRRIAQYATPGIGAFGPDLWSMSPFIYRGIPYVSLARNGAVVINLETEDFSIFNNTNSSPHEDGDISSGLISTANWGSLGVIAFDQGTQLLTAEANHFQTYTDNSFVDADGANTKAMMSSFETGWISHKDPRRKRSEELIMCCYKDDVNNTPEIYAKYRDDGNSTWSNPRQLELSQNTDQYAVFKLFRNGMYTKRQWIFYCSNNAPFSVGEIHENYTPLMS